MARRFAVRHANTPAGNPRAARRRADPAPEAGALAGSASGCGTPRGDRDQEARPFGDAGNHEPLCTAFVCRTRFSDQRRGALFHRLAADPGELAGYPCLLR